jgi:hypothetical protein
MSPRPSLERAAFADKDPWHAPLALVDAAGKLMVNMPFPEGICRYLLPIFLRFPGAAPNMIQRSQVTAERDSLTKAGLVVWVVLQSVRTIGAKALVSRR